MSGMVRVGRVMERVAERVSERMGDFVVRGVEIMNAVRSGGGFVVRGGLGSIVFAGGFVWVLCVERESNVGRARSVDAGLLARNAYGQLVAALMFLSGGVC